VVGLLFGNHARALSEGEPEREELVVRRVAGDHLDSWQLGVDGVRSAAREGAHWCTLVVSAVSYEPLMHPRCRRVIALLA